MNERPTLEELNKIMRRNGGWLDKGHYGAERFKSFFEEVKE